MCKRLSNIAPSVVLFIIIFSYKQEYLTSVLYSVLTSKIVVQVLLSQLSLGEKEESGRYIFKHILLFSKIFQRFTTIYFSSYPLSSKERARVRSYYASSVEASSFASSFLGAAFFSVFSSATSIPSGTG